MNIKTIKEWISSFWAHSKTAIPFFISGVIITYLVYNNFFIPNMINQIDLLKKAKTLEEQKSELKDESMEILKNKIEYLTTKLQYKTEDDLLLISQLQSKTEKLEAENINLEKIKEEYENINKEKFEFAKLTAKYEKLKIEKDTLAKKLAQLTNEILAKSIHLYKDKSWSGQEGKAIVGLLNVDYHASGKSSATIMLNGVIKAEVVVGTQIKHSVLEGTYILSIEEISYISDSIVFSLYYSKK